MQLLQKRFYENALKAEMAMHLGYSKHERSEETPVKNSRNGFGSKTLNTDNGSIETVTPRDRNGSFSPEIVPKRQTSLTSFKEKIIALYSHGMSVRDIQSGLEEMYSVDVSEGFIILNS